MEQLISKPHGCSIEEYFQLAEASPTKLEFKDGQLINMAGASYNHNLIAANLIRSVGNRLAGRACNAIGSDMRVKTAADRYCYPDGLIICGGPTFDPLDSTRTITNPQVIFEVLSPSTESADRGEKFFNYIRLASLQEYFLIAQDKPRIESFERQPSGKWEVGRIAEGLDAPIAIRSLNIELPMREIYRDVTFDEKMIGG